MHRRAVTCSALAVAVPVSVAALAYDPLAAAATSKRCVALLVAIVVLGLVVTRPARRPMALATPVVAFAAFVAWSALTLAYGSPAGARDLAAWGAGACLALVTGAWPRARAERVAAWTAAITGTLAALAAVIEAALGARGLLVHGGQGNANWLGLLLAVTMPLTLATSANDPRAGAARLATIASFALQAAGLALSHSRVAWVAAVATLVPLAVVAHRARPSTPRAWVAASAVLGVVVGIATSSGAWTKSAAGHASNRDVPVALAWKGRTWIWRTSVDAALASLPAGAGLGGFPRAFLEAQGSRLRDLAPKEASRAFVNATTAHSDWLEVAVDSGPLALLLLGATVLAALRALRRWPAGAASALAFAICAAGDSPLRQPAIVLVLALVLGAARSGARRAASERPSRVLLGARAAFLAGSALLLADATRAWAAERALTRAREADPVGKHALLEHAARVDTWNGEGWLELGLLDLEIGDLEAARAALLRSQDLLANVGTRVALGNVAMASKDPSAAVDAYGAALRLSPGSFRAHANLGRALTTLHRFDEAERHLSIASQLWPGDPTLAAMRDDLRRARFLDEAPASAEPIEGTLADPDDVPAAGPPPD